LSKEEMQRLIARFLLLVLLAGTFAPLALAAAAPPPHACCIRKATHHCHDSAATEQISESGQLAIRGTSCCNHDCCRAVTTARWAHAQRASSAFFKGNVETYLRQPITASPNSEPSRLQSSRAPPHSKA
jgi:hypothetical protein